MDISLNITSPTLSKSNVYYPESDGKPMGETGFHVRAILGLYQALIQFFEQTEQVYVAADMFFYYEEGNRAANKSPDVFVVKGVSKEERRVYKLWEEGVVPCAIFEITSKSTRREDVTNKRKLYESLGVPEYFLFDPLDEYLTPRFQGFELVEGIYQPLPFSVEGTLFSQALGTILKPEGAYLRVIDPIANQVVPTLNEAMGQIETEAERAKAEAERAQAEAERAQAEAQRADSAEAELARLQAKLKQLGLQTDEN